MTKRYQYLLDTNIISELMRNPRGVIRNRIAAVGEETICTSIVVSGELLFGVQKKGSERLRFQLSSILSAIDILPLDQPSDRHYAILRNYLEKSGTPIGPNDMLIAAQALAMDLIVVTANTKEFSRITELRVENWLIENK